MSIESKIDRMIQFMQEDINQRVSEVYQKSKEQAQLVSQQLQITETKKVEKEIEAQLKSAKQNLQIQQSGILNQVRLQVLRARDEVVQQTLDKCKEAIQNHQNYEDILKKLVIQGAQLLQSDNIVVQLCRGDEAYFGGVKSICQQNGITAVQHEKQLDKEDYIGGLNVYTADKRIYVENNFQKRLQLAYRRIAPEVSAILFEDSSALW